MAAATQEALKPYDERLDEAGKYLEAAAKEGEGPTARPAREALIEACRILHINRETATQFADVYDTIVIAGLSGAATQLGVAINGEAEDRKCLDLEAVVGVPLDPRDAQGAPVILTLTDTDTGERASALASLRQLDEIVDGIKSAMQDVYLQYPPDLLIDILASSFDRKKEE